MNLLASLSARDTFKAAQAFLHVRPTGTEASSETDPVVPCLAELHLLLRPGLLCLHASWMHLNASVPFSVHAKLPLVDPMTSQNLILAPSIDPDCLFVQTCLLLMLRRGSWPLSSLPQSHSQSQPQAQAGPELRPFAVPVALGCSLDVQAPSSTLPSQSVSFHSWPGRWMFCNASDMSSHKTLPIWISEDDKTLEFTDLYRLFAVLLGQPGATNDLLHRIRKELRFFVLLRLWKSPFSSTIVEPAYSLGLPFLLRAPLMFWRRRQVLADIRSFDPQALLDTALALLESLGCLYDSMDKSSIDSWSVVDAALFSFLYFLSLHDPSLILPPSIQTLLDNMFHCLFKPS